MSKRDREKRKLARLREKERLEEQELLEEAEELQEDAPEEQAKKEAQEEGVSEKSYDEVGDPYYGATSWEELDKERKAREQAEMVRRETWNVEDLVSNITRNPMMDANTKGEAIAKVGSGFAKRVKTIMSSETMEKEIDIELLEVEALIAKDLRHIPVSERVGDWITKKKLTYAAEQKLSDSDFALVIKRDGKTVRKYPIHDKAHVRNALARAAQQINAGGEGATDAKAALPKIRAAAKKMGIGMEKASSSIMVEKGQDGQWRAVMWPTNNFMDRDGETLSEKAHKEYVDWVNKNMDLAPVFTTWHKSDLVRKNQVDFVGYENGFVIMSSPLTEDEAVGLFNVMKKCDVGMSHGTLVLERDPLDNNVINKYRTVEVSDLPLENAANPFTDFAIISKEADMNTEEYLSALIGEERTKAFLEKTGMKQEALRKAGVQEKDDKAEDAPADQPAAKTPSTDMQAILDAVRKEFDIPGLNESFAKLQESAEKVPVLEALVKELSKNRDEELAEQISPPIAKKMAWSRPSQDDSTVVKKDDKEDEGLLGSEPHWLSKVSGTAPVEAGG